VNREATLHEAEVAKTGNRSTGHIVHKCKVTPLAAIAEDANGRSFVYPSDKRAFTMGASE